jgi:hypothetical protein
MLLMIVLLQTADRAALPADLLSLSLAVAQVEAIVPIPTDDLLAVAWVETAGRYRSDLVSRAGACGVMQVLPKWSEASCADMAYPLHGFVAGAAAWAYWERRRPLQTAEHYNGGNNPGARAQSYAIVWERRLEAIRAVGVTRTRKAPLE